jgi:hypothetical protein
MNVAIKESIFHFRERTIETSGIPIFKIWNILYPLVGAEQPELDQKIVRETELGFRFILQCSVRSGPLYQSPLGVVFKFLLACSLGIRALGESEDVARVSALLPAFSSFSSFSQLAPAGLRAIAAGSEAPLAALSSSSLGSGFLLLLWSNLGRNSRPA